MAFLERIFSPGRRGIAGRRASLWGTLLLGLASLATGAEQAPPPPAPPPLEYQVKAAFLYHFAQFVEWPPRAFPAPDSAFVIGIMGEDPFGPYLVNLVGGEKVGGRKMLIRRVATESDFADCQIVFIARSETPQLSRIMPELRGKSILTVSDAEGFNREGGIIRLVTDAGKIRLHINLAAAKSAGLEISSKLLRPATIVTSDEK